TAGVIGGLVGSLLNTPAQATYRHVYTLKAANGDVSTVEKVTESPIYVPTGLCVETSSLTPVNDNLCERGLPSELAAFLGAQSGNSTESIAKKETTAPVSAPVVAQGELVACRLGTTSNIQTTAEKCKQAGGTLRP